ncbi:MAG: hypothetical protein U9P90_01475 [Patescibacteria group bacterium]|nr:hypothetical protein [Patescibacteria group bacterium]
MAIDILLPIALDAVVKAEAHGGTGNEKFNYALEYMQKEVPDAAIGKVKSAIQDAWLIKEAEGWK